MKRAIPLRSVLRFSAGVEICTAAALMIDPTIVVRVLLGGDVVGVGEWLGRCFGIALLALGVACWPGRTQPGNDRSAFVALMIYNVLVALYLAYLGSIGGQRGVLLWPAVALHAVVALLLVRARPGVSPPANGS